AAEMKVTQPRRLLGRVDQDRSRRILGERKGRRTPEGQVVEPNPHLAPAAATAQPASSGKTARAADRGAAQGRVVGARIQRFGDNVDTDAIIPGEFCHLTSLAELGAKAFHYVRPEFVQRAREGATVIVAGEGWGSGSSREQAVLALKGAGIQPIVAKSYAFIHKANRVIEVRSDDLHRLPKDLPVPVDDGAARHLPHMMVPPIALPSTRGREVVLADESQQARVVVFAYPRTGEPDKDLPPGWDAIPGARGCTPQSCGFRDVHAEF